jgi:hypothetical protein
MSEVKSATAVPKTPMQTFLDAVHFLGSIASITGITLLWLRGTVAISPLEIAWFACIVSLFVGLTATFIALVRHIYIRWFRHKDMVVKVAFFGLATPISTLLIIIVGVAVVIGVKNVFSIRL